MYFRNLDRYFYCCYALFPPHFRMLTTIYYPMYLGGVVILLRYHNAIDSVSLFDERFHFIALILFNPVDDKGLIRMMWQTDETS